MNPRIPNYLRSTFQWGNYILATVAFISWFLLLNHLDQVDKTSPRSPSLATGEVVPVHWKSIVVYERASDARLHRFVLYLAIPFAVFIITSFLISRKKRKRPPE